MNKSKKCKREKGQLIIEKIKNEVEGERFSRLHVYIDGIKSMIDNKRMLQVDKFYMKTFLFIISKRRPKTKEKKSLYYG